MNHALHIARQRLRTRPICRLPIRQGPGEPAQEGEEGLELPVNPDQGTPLVPDEEGEVTAPA